MSINKDLARSFFPTIISFISSPELAPSFVVDTFNAIFPDDGEGLCSFPPETRAYVLQRPWLAIACVAGAVIGFGLGTDGRAKDFVASSIHDSWSKALRAFGFMNVFALVHHCLLPPPARYDDESRARKYVDVTMWAADCICTGLSSMNLAVLAMLVYRSDMVMGKKQGWDAATWQLFVRRQRMGVHAVLISTAAVIPTLCQLLYNGRVDLWGALGTSIELTYLLPVGVAASSLFPLVALSAYGAPGFRSKKATSGARFAISGGALAVVFVPFDATLCRFVAKHAPSVTQSPFLYDMYQMPTMVFAGCNVAFLGLNLWVNDILSELTKKGKER